MTDHSYSRHTLDLLPQLIWVAAPDGTVEYVNRWCREYCGVPLDDLLGWDWRWVVHPDDLSATMTAWDKAVRTGTPHEIQPRLRRHDGEYRWFLVRGEPVRNANGTIVRWFGTATDIDETKQWVDSLQSTRARFWALVQRSPDGLALVTSDGAVRYSNTTAVRLLDFSADDLVGTNLWRSVSQTDHNKWREWLNGVLAGPGERQVVTLHFILRDRTFRQLEVLATNLLPDPDVRAVAVQLRMVGAG